MLDLFNKVQDFIRVSLLTSSKVMNKKKVKKPTIKLKEKKDSQRFKRKIKRLHYKMLKNFYD